MLRPAQPAYEPLYQDTVVSRRHLFPITLLTMFALMVVTVTSWMSYEKFENGPISWREYLHNSKETSMTLDTRRWCNFNGVDQYPKGSDSWFQRMPSFMILGEGQDLALELIEMKHPMILPPQNHLETNNLYFIPMQDDSQDNNLFLRFKHPRVHVKDAREFLWKEGGYPVGLLYQHDHLHSFEVSTQYLLDSIHLMPRLFCVCPWIKLVVVLRNPIDRLWDEYQSIAASIDVAPLEDLLKHEFDLLEPFLESTVDTPLEDRSWKDYLAAIQREEHPPLLGRGLYDVQVRYLLRAMKSFGVDASKHLLIVRYEDFHSTTTSSSSSSSSATTNSGSSKLDSVLNFLFKSKKNMKIIKKLSDSQSAILHAVEPVDPIDSQQFHRQGQSAVVPARMQPSTRLILEKFFEYHNQRLARMLDWNDPWPPQNEVRKLTTRRDASKVYASMFHGPI